jgi:hypothetical protein
MAELVHRDRREVDRARGGIDCGRIGSEAEAVRGLRIELHVVVEDRARSVKARRELDVAVIVGVGRHRDGTRYVRVAVAVDIVPVHERGVFD